MDGTEAVVAMETAGSEAAGAYPITPSTQMGEGWALASAQGKLNVNGRRLLFFEPEGEHAAAGVTAGMAMVGLRSANFSSGQGIAYMHESLYAAVGKRLTYVLNIACRAMTKHALNVHAGHDDYHAIDDTGFFQVFAKDAQEAADLNLLAHRIAELTLNPGVCAQDGFLTSHVIESLRLPERALVKEYLGDPADIIESPTPAQRMVFGEMRRRIPEIFDYDNPAMIGVVQNQDSYAQGVAAQRPFFFDHVADLADRAMEEYAALTGRRYARASGYRTDDAEYVLVGQGSVVANAEAAADHLRKQGHKVGVVNVTMFRPFPADRLVRLLRGKKGAVVLERADQPLAVDAPLLREIRAAMAKAVENARFGNGTRPHPALEACPPEAVPAFYSGCFGMGSRDLQPGDIVAAFENMFPDGGQRRQFYLGIDFIRKGATHPSVREWQEKIERAYPEVAALSLQSSENVDLLPPGSLAVRIHSVGGWGAITMGKNLTMTLFDLLGMYVKSNPKYGSEKKGQPTTFYGVFAHEPVRLNCELRHVDVVLSPDPNVFRHSNALAGIREGGALVIQHDQAPEALWKKFPAWAQKAIREKKVHVFHVDGFGIARAETDVADLQYRMQGAAFQGAFFKASPIMERESLDETKLFAAIRKQLEKKFGHRGPKVVEDNFRVIRRGFEEVKELDWASFADSERAAPADTAITAPWYLGEADTAAGIGDPHRFAAQVCALYRAGEDPIADPFAALSAIPAATGVFRDMTNIRFEVPEFIADRCTGCAQCWVQCPDAAIPGLVSEIDDVLKLAVNEAGNGGGNTRMAGLLEPLARESRRRMREEPAFTTFASVVSRAYTAVAGELKLAGAERTALDAEFAGVESVLADLPLARTAPFFTVPERRQEGSGGLLSITINPYACKGCNLCVEVCPDQALVTVKQDDTVVDKLKRNWTRRNALPDTPDRFVQVANLDEGIGVLSSLLLKKDTFESMLGGDGSCMGCGEKTGVHLIVAAIEAHMQPRVGAFLERIEALLEALEKKSSRLLLATTDLETVAGTGPVHLDVNLREEDRTRLSRIARLQKTLKDLRWRYTSGPSGRGRAAVGITNATGCSSVWGSTYPYNPYPYPWTNHLFQDAPSVAIGIFEGLMRKMADGFIAVRKAGLEAEDAYDPATHDPFFEAFTWREFSDDEFRLCPPVMAIGGDGAMLDIGFQNVSRLMASGKPIRVLMLDTQVYSNTGGQACTSGFLGQISDMAAYGAARHGKEEQRKEMGLIAIAHRNTFVLQSSQALPSHLIGGVLRGLNSRHPAIFNLYSPCQAEHGLPDSGSARAAKLALESRAFPFFVYDPDGGPGLAGKLDLEGNPELEAAWPAYELTYLEDGVERTMSLPLTVPDWAATEPRFARHFKKVERARWDDRMVPVHEYLDLGPGDREGKIPFIHVLDDEKALSRLSVSSEMITLTEDRLVLWEEIKEMAGVRVTDPVRKRLLSPLEREYETKVSALRSEYEGKIADLKKTYPVLITRRIAEALVGGNGGGLSGLSGPGVAPRRAPSAPRPAAVAAPAPVAAPPSAAAPVAAPEAPPAPSEAGEVVEPYIDTELCTSCNDCLQISKQLFAYDGEKRAYIKDPRGGTFQQLVRAAEKCPARVIHPGTPLDPNEPDLDKWVERAKQFN
jgi:pyruvate-ferredoxin/flavodoxin oxidoreductase